MIQALGWFANAILVAGLWKIGDKWKPAFILTFIGESMWTYKAVVENNWDLAVICFIFAVVAIRNLITWQN